MQRPEQLIHKAIVSHLRLRGARGLVFFHVPNAIHGSGRRFHVQGAIAKSLGVRAGVSDLILLHQGRAYALELKAAGGKPTPAQKQFCADFYAAGGTSCVVFGVDQAIETLERWGLLRRAVT